MDNGTALGIKQVKVSRDVTVPAGKPVMIGITIKRSEPLDGPLLLEDYDDLKGTVLEIQ